MSLGTRCLLDPVENDFTAPATARCGRDHIFQFVRCDRQRSLLLRSVPVWVRTALDVQDEGMIRFVDRVSAECRDAALHRGFVLVRGVLLSEANLGTSARTTNET